MGWWGCSDAGNRRRRLFDSFRIFALRTLERLLGSSHVDPNQFDKFISARLVRGNDSLRAQVLQHTRVDDVRRADGGIGREQCLDVIQCDSRFWDATAYRPDAP